MNRILVLVILIIVLMSIATVVWNYKNSLDFALQKYGIAISETRNFDITERDASNLVASNEVEVIKIEIKKNVDLEGAEKYRIKQFTLFNSLFESQLPPYPEFLTNEVSCPEQFQPVFKDHPLGGYYETFAGERLNFGVCIDDLATHKALFGVFYCSKSETIFKVEYFTDKSKENDSLDRIADSIRCL